MIARLLDLREPEGNLVTVTLDVAKTGILPETTRVFLKDALHSLPAEGGLPQIARRIRDYVDRELRPESDGVCLVAGPNQWEAIELRVPLPNLLHRGSVPYLAPLVAAMQEFPKTYVVSVSERDAGLRSVELGDWSDLGHWTVEALDRDPERILSGRSPAGRFALRQRAGSGIGGSKRDRFDRALESQTARMLAGLTHRIAADHAFAPASVVCCFGDHEHFPLLRRLLPATLQGRAEDLGPAPRDEPSVRAAVEDVLKRRAAERRDSELREFYQRRGQGYLVALGPADVLVHRTSGKLARVFLDALDPVMATQCRSC
ncbi:MAG: hypothetical protein JO332_11535, partial [Planctomycetaceae bacterium]|nr:hypothetical protein [Planctomycetaceae bacterium]